MATAPLSFEEWSPAHLDAAAELLTARHQRHREHRPELPTLDNDAARQALEVISDSPGYAALREDTVVGYIVYRAITEGAFAGHAWVDLAGQAATDTETTRSLYAHVADQWVAQGLRQHAVHVPAVDDHLWPWFVSSFGIQHTWALRSSDPLRPSPRSSHVVVRRIGPDEAATAGKAELDLDDHLRKSPVFSGVGPSARDDAIAGQKEFLEDPGVYAVVAEYDGTHLGYGEVTADPKGDMRAPRGSATVGIVVVEAEARGLGVGRTITGAMLDWARTQGHQHVICDWRATNLDSSRAFTSFGWEPTFYRLHRAIP
jgi:GNAT superfamily N-acetyltransferase